MLENISQAKLGLATSIAVFDKMWVSSTTWGLEK